jgi:hypothetical protein
MAHPELWYFLAPAEEGKEMEFGHLEEVGRARLLPQNGKLGAGLTARLLAPLRFARTQAGLLRRRASMEKDEAPPRPGSALRDKTGRRMVYGNPSFRFAQIVSASAAWALHGRCMGAAWALHGLCMGSASAPSLRCLCDGGRAGRGGEGEKKHKE